MNIAERFETASATVVGGEHVGAGGTVGSGNNQDAMLVTASADYLLAVVCDGCSDRAESGVGAAILTRLFAKCVAQLIASGEALKHPDKAVKLLDAAVVKELEHVARLLASSEADIKAVADELFLATLTAVIITPQRTLVVSCGDGMWGINGRFGQVESGKRNEPPYLGYRIRDGQACGSNLALVTSVASESVESVMVGSDGCQYLSNPSSFLDQDRLFKKPILLTRELRRLNQESVRLESAPESSGLTVNVRVVRSERSLSDDTSLVLIRRRPIIRPSPLIEERTQTGKVPHEEEMEADRPQRWNWLSGSGRKSTHDAKKGHG